MRYLFLSLLFICFSTYANYNSFNKNNSSEIKALVYYSANSQGFYDKSENILFDSICNISQIFAYDKTTQELYSTTENGIFVIKLNKQYAKKVKKDKSIPQLKLREIAKIFRDKRSILDERFLSLNNIRHKIISDSIAEVEDQERIRIAKEKARRDSLEKARQDSIFKENLIKKATLYKEQHNWDCIPLPPSKNGSYTLDCDMCDDTKYISKYSSTDSIFALGIYNDTLYSAKTTTGLFGVEQKHIHAYKIPQDLKNSEAFQYHLEVFADSLNRDSSLYNNKIVNLYNIAEEQKYISKISSLAPYGFIFDWSWGNEYYSISFEIEYYNLNKKTIKYIDFYWRVMNDVNDVRGTGHFKGTGPIEQFNGGKWEWDHSSYYVAGDASNMEITKIIITYMNGSQKILTGNKIKYADIEE